MKLSTANLFDSPELGHVRILHATQIKPSPENDRLYRPIDPHDPEIHALAESIKEHGLREPIVITTDGWIISGHRRFEACLKAGLYSIPTRRESISRENNPDEFLRLLREYNRQRVKSADEQFREEVVSANPEEAHRLLIEHRKKASGIIGDTFELREETTRAKITDAKLPFLTAIQKVIRSRKDFWPLSDRQIHYALLNDPPLKRASKPDSVYGNDDPSYKALSDLLTRARLEGIIPFYVIHDPTRPVSTWGCHRDNSLFLREKLNGFLKDYYRDLLQSQPNHIEIVGEKNTVASIIRPVAMEYCIPVTIGRGFCSLAPRHEMAERFRKSGKEKLILLILSDFDPDGEEIAHSFARSIRDDFGIEDVEPIKVAITREQIDEMELPPQLKAKKTSTNYRRFVGRHGDDVYELEAIPPRELQGILRQAIDSVIDVDLFNAEIEREKEDAAHLDTVRRQALQALKGWME